MEGVALAPGGGDGVDPLRESKEIKGSTKRSKLRRRAEERTCSGLETIIWQSM